MQTHSSQRAHFTTSFSANTRNTKHSPTKRTTIRYGSQAHTQGLAGLATVYLFSVSFALCGFAHSVSVCLLQGNSRDRVGLLLPLEFARSFRRLFAARLLGSYGRKQQIRPAGDSAMLG